MFIKPYKLKSNAPLKSSDVKRLRLQLEKSFPNATSEDLQKLLPAKAAVTMLKIMTHSGVQTLVYCVEKQPMFFQTAAASEHNQADAVEKLAPTLYAMWLVPALLPYFTTHPNVLPKLSNGADLMLPGVILQSSDMNRYGRHRRGQLVAVNLTSNAAAVGVGYLPRSSDDLFMCGGQGTAVKMLHLFGDKLWAHEPALAQQVPNQRPADLTRDDFPALGAEPKKTPKTTPPTTLAGIVAQAKAAEVAAAPPLPDIAQLEISTNGEKCIPSTSDSPQTTTTPSTADDEISPEQVLKNAFLAALKHHGKTLQLPLLTSNFYRLYVVNEAAQDIDLKKTRYKKLSNFLAEMVDQGFVVVREETKGVDKITSIDLEHPELVNFITDYKRPSAATTNAHHDDDDEPAPLFYSELTELYIVSDVTAAFFTRLNYKRGEGIPAGQIKKIVREYISKHSLPLADPVTRSVRLDEILAALCDRPTATISQISGAVTALMEHSYQMCSVKDVAANKPLIQMSLATRSGNKKVTIVSNVECYGIIVPEFIKLCKQGAAASTTVIKLPHQKREQLQIQGNQVRFIHTLLTETYKVPPKCILGLELAKDGKKHKKK